MLSGDKMRKGLGGAGALGRCNEIGARWSECSRAIEYVRARWSVALGPGKGCNSVERSSRDINMD